MASGEHSKSCSSRIPMAMMSSGHRVRRLFCHESTPGAGQPMQAKAKAILRKDILRSLRKQGYVVRGGRVALPADSTKNDLRHLNRLACLKKLNDALPRLAHHETRLLEQIASGCEVVPEKVQPRLVQVQSGSKDELLFRYVCLHWSIPVSSGYGRRLRFLVVDRSNGKLMGLFGLGDPVYSLGPRDEWIGWDAETKKDRLYHVMDAFVLGAVPPYSKLMCGKLVAMLAMSDTVRKAFRIRYGGRETVISGKLRKPYLGLITTTSALGRSSLYNRIRINDFDYWHQIGSTRGWGEFHFSNGVYADLRAYAEKWCEPTAKKKPWGDGYRNKREVIRKVLSRIGLSRDLCNHGIKREIYAAPLGENALAFLRGETEWPLFFSRTESQLWQAFRERWFLDRATRCPEFMAFDRESYRLWTDQPRSSL